MPSLESGARLGPYEIVSPLGEGGMGEVYRAHDARLGRDVAIKVLPRRLAANADLRARFEREARTLSRLKHPHVCTLHDVGREGDTEFLVLELIEGETLAARLRRGPLAIGDWLAFAAQAAGALAAAHREGLVHRDVKPANLMLTESGIKLLDFGLASPGTPVELAGGMSQAPTVHEPLTSAGAIVGTFAYMAPEQLEGREADARSDVFGLGCVLYEMATATRPFGAAEGLGSLRAMLHARPLPASSVNPALPEGLDRVLERCLEEDPAKRYANAAELADAIERLRRWPAEEGVPRVRELAERTMTMEETGDSWAAYLLAREVEKLSPEEARAAALFTVCTSPVTIRTDPPGASVRARFYGEPDGTWTEFGVTPVVDRAFPRGVTRLELVKDGFCTAEDVVLNLSRSLNNATDPVAATWDYVLRPAGAPPAEMADVSGGCSPLFMPGLDHLEPEPLGPFLMDRHPVTNREFRRFVDEGGYAREEFWREPFVAADGAVLPRGEAMARFTDTLGRPGPATWALGECPAGEDEHPVAGVSWYEAAAYAAWAGKTLPSAFHWNWVAQTFCSAQLAPLANFSGRGTVAVGTTRSVNRFGVHDLAGNVREWSLNPVTRTGERLILGGGWNDMGYAFMDAYAQSAFDRSATNGFRCVRVSLSPAESERLGRTLELPFRDFRAETPVPDEVFAFFLRQFHYDRTPLAARVVAEQDVPFGRWQTVEFAAAYGGERMQAHLVLPPRGRPPFQVAVLFPGSLAIHNRNFTLAEVQRLDFIVRSGRALVLPIYKGTYERGGELHTDYPEATAAYRDHVVMWGRDLARTIDYLETRDDLDATRVAYVGLSWGGTMGTILPAVEKRIRANVLYVAGFCFQRALPEVDQVNYVGRVTQPTLMLNGELDFFFPAATSQEPMFEMLGTPPALKKRLTYPRGHTVPRLDFMRESLAWLDEHLGRAD